MTISIVIWLLISNSSAQEKGLDIADFVKTVSFNEVLTGLGDNDIASTLERNRILSRAIDARGVGFEMSPSARRTIEEAGGSELLLIAIDRAQAKRTEEIARLPAEFTRLDRQIFYDLDRNIENRQNVIRHLRELLDKMGDPELFQEIAYRKQVRSLKEKLVRYEKDLSLLIEKRQIQLIFSRV
ncbi:MAG: hypothetical protein QM785_03160 [Pyrinomonadaceae bacterium]